MLRNGFLAATLVSAFTLPAAAQDAHDFLNGVYASEEETCPPLKTSGLAGMEDGTVVTAEGLWASEYTCDFVDVKANKGPLGGWIASAICEESDSVFPDLVAIVPDGENDVRVSFLTDPFISSDESAVEEETDAEAEADDATAESDASAAETGAESDTEAEDTASEASDDTASDDTASDDTAADEESDENLYVFCPGVTKQDLAKGAPN